MGRSNGGARRLRTGQVDGAQVLAAPVIAAWDAAGVTTVHRLGDNMGRGPLFESRGGVVVAEPSEVEKLPVIKDLVHRRIVGELRVSMGERLD